MVDLSALPDPGEQELINGFAVNKNYLQAIAGFLEHTYGDGTDMYRGIASALAKHKPYTKIQRASQIPVDDVKRFLLLAWASEIQLHLPTLIGQETTVSFSNAWAPVHAYYSVFGALQAWFAANGMAGVNDDHTATLRTISSMIEKRDLLPPPWNLLATGCATRGERAYLNNCGEDCSSNVEGLSIPLPGADPSFWSRYGTWLRSTRRARLQRKEDEWKQKNGRTKISVKVRDHYAATLHPTSMFDCFWRMRIKSNYGKIDSYLTTHITDGDHALFNRGLCTTTRATVCLLELLVMQRVGRAKFKETASEFLRQDASQLSQRTLGRRMDAYGLSD